MNDEFTGIYRVKDDAVEPENLVTKRIKQREANVKRINNIVLDYLFAIAQSTGSQSEDVERVESPENVERPDSKYLIVSTKKRASEP